MNEWISLLVLFETTGMDAVGGQELEGKPQGSLSKVHGGATAQDSCHLVCCTPLHTMLTSSAHIFFMLTATAFSLGSANKGPLLPFQSFRAARSSERSHTKSSLSMSGPPPPGIWDPIRPAFLPLTNP